MCCTRLAGNAGPNKSPKIRHLGTLAQLCRATSSQLKHVSSIGKKLVKQQCRPTRPHNMVNFGPLAAEIGSLVWGTPANFNRFHVLAALLHDTLVVGISETLRRWSEGATYIRQGGHRVGHWSMSQKNVPPLACYNFDTHEWILIFFGRNVMDKVGNQKTLYYATSNNLCFCTTWQKWGNKKITFSTHLHCVACTVHLCAVFLKEKLSSVMCLIASNICWDSKISH